MVAKIHHYVPRCYLRGFGKPTKTTHQALVFDRISQKSYPAAVENIGAERDFNTVDIEGKPPDIIETAFGVFENEVGPALVRIDQARSLKDQNDRELLLNLVALMATRNPRFRANWKDFEVRTMKMMLGAMTSTPEIWANHVKGMRSKGYLGDDNKVADNYERMREFVSGDNYTIEIPPVRHVDLELENLDSILQCIGSRKWWLLRATDETGDFITSDHPVCLMWSDPSKRGHAPFPPGFGLKGTQVIFPISSRLLMVGAFELEEAEDDALPHMVAAFNGTIAQYARRQAYARDSNFRYVFERGEKPKGGAELASDPRFKREIKSEDDEDDD